MGLILPQEVEVELLNSGIKRYEDLGYDVPRRIDKKGRLSVAKGTKIKVNVLHLPLGSNKIVMVEILNATLSAT